jgi:hypothetical protein
MREASQLTFDLRTVRQLIYALFVASQLCIGVNLSLFCVFFPAYARPMQIYTLLCGQPLVSLRSLFGLWCIFACFACSLYASARFPYKCIDEFALRVACILTLTLSIVVQLSLFDV